MSFSVRLNPLNRVWRGDEKIDLATAAADCDVALDFPCGGVSRCGKCRVRVTQGATAPTNHELEVLGREAVGEGWRLGCTLELRGPATIELPNAIRAMPLKSFGPSELPAMGGGTGYGFAVDVGTTTIAVGLVDLQTTKVVGSMSQVNPQIMYGADVMTRISYAQMNHHGSRELHVRIVATLNLMFREILSSASIPMSQVRSIVFVGNTTMMHTLVGADVCQLGETPYEGELHGAWQGFAPEIGLSLPSNVVVYCSPVIRSHIGGDTTANLVATSFDTSREPRLLIDLGTNTEIALVSNGRITVTSASGGPAFEGGSIRQGMRAIPGAIDQLRIGPSGRIRAHTVARAQPIGICGSGVLDAVAEMLRVGVVEWSGRMLGGEEIEATAGLSRRLLFTEVHGRGLWVAGPADDPIVVTADDVRQLQLVKGSIGAAISMLLEHAGLELEDLAEILVAGAFGNYIRKSSALAIGLFPGVDAERIHLVGHAAGIGARMMLLDAGMRERAEQIAAAAEFVDLAGREDYSERFVAALPFPAPVAAIA